MALTKKTIKEYILDIFRENPNKIFQLKEIDRMANANFQRENNSTDTIYINRTVRALHTQGYIEELKGYLEKPKKGNYIFKKGKKTYFPKSPFPKKTIVRIKKRDKNQCQFCGKKDSIEDPLAVDHIHPENDGGKGVYENGITLCTKCNNIKSNLNVTSFGKKVFEKYLLIAKKNKLTETVTFLEDLLKIYKKHKMK